MLGRLNEPKQSVLVAAATNIWLLAEIWAAVAGVMGEIAVSAFFVISHPNQYQSKSRDPPVSVSFDRPLDYRLGL